METMALYNAINAAKSGEDGFNAVMMAEIMSKLLEDAKKTTAKETGNLQRYNEAKKIINNKLNKNRPILQKCVYRDGFQVFTDSYTLLKLASDLFIDELETHNNADTERYPKIDSLFSASYDCLIPFNVGELKTALKATPKSEEDKKTCIYKYEKEGSAFAVDAVRLLAALIILNFRNDDIVEIEYRRSHTERFTVHPLLLKNNGSVALVLPMRIPEKKENE